MELYADCAKMSILSMVCFRLTLPVRLMDEENVRIRVTKAVLDISFNGHLFVATVDYFKSVESSTLRRIIGNGNELVRSKQFDSNWFNTPHFIKMFEVERLDRSFFLAN